jgi:hypothetical protein
MQWRSNRVSSESLLKTGIFAVVAGDFSRNGLRVLQFGSSETGAELQKPANSGLFSPLRGTISGFRTAWLGREDSNLRMVESKSTALPLGDAPMTCLESGGTIAARIPSGNARSIEGVEPFQQAGTANSPRICTGILPSLYEGFLADGAALPGFEIAPPPGSPAAHPTHRGVAAPRGVERAAVSWEDGSLPSLSERDHGHDLSRADQ